MLNPLVALIPLVLGEPLAAPQSAAKHSVPVKPLASAKAKAKAASSKTAPQAKPPVHAPILKPADDPDYRAERAIIDGMVLRGRQAQERGDFALAEHEYQNAVARDGGPFLRIRLARLYDATGRDRDAYVQYRAILRASPEAGSSSSQDDPRVLAHYGELCLEFGDRNEARAAYVAAITQSTCGTSHLEPKIAPRNASFDAVRAAALLAWAMKSGSIGDTKTQTARLEAAERIDPANWMVRFYRARELSRAQHREEAQAEADKALSLAPRSSRGQIIDMMDVRGLSLPQPTTTPLLQGR